MFYCTFTHRRFPDLTPESSVTVYVSANDDSGNQGKTSCETNVGRPVNVTNGNMYLEQIDYRLRGVGDGLELSAPTTAGIKLGLFGYGGARYWMSWVVPYGTKLLRLNLDLV